jgi:two-component system phosphate regulon response regulator PhoB
LVETGLQMTAMSETLQPIAKQRSILVIEDESDLAELLRYNFEREGYTCLVAAEGHSALGAVQRVRPDLVILDRMLPGMSGDKVITQLRRDQRLSTVPVIMLTAKVEESDELVGLALGADDYVTKPFSMKLLLARVAAMFRRVDAEGPPSDVLAAGPIRLDASRYELKVDGESVALTATEFGLLRTLMAAHGRVLSRSRLIESVMGTGVAVTDRTIDVHVTALRKKLGKASGWIQTVRGVGYTFREPT